MAQFARPDGDVTSTSFTNGFAAIDEATASDADFAYGANNTAAELEVSLGNVTDPSSATGHVFRYRIARTKAGTVDGTGNAVTVTARLMQGATQVAADAAQTATGTWTEYAYTLSGAEADAITDYTDLRLEFVTSASGGSPANRRGAAVSWAELEVPSAASPSGTGSPAVPSATVSGTGTHAESPSGTGAVAVGAPVLAGTGVLTLTATGAVTVGPPAVSGSGAETFTATGATAAPAATAAGSGTLDFTATGAVASGAPTVAGTGDHTVSGAEPSGSGAPAVPAATVAGSGVLTFTATGAVGAPAATAVGSGALVLTGSGAVSVPVALIVGAGAEAFTGTGAAGGTAPSVVAAGSAGAETVGGLPPSGQGSSFIPSGAAIAASLTPSGTAYHPKPGA